MIVSLYTLKTYFPAFTILHTSYLMIIINKWWKGQKRILNIQKRIYGIMKNNFLNNLCNYLINQQLKIRCLKKKFILRKRLLVHIVNCILDDIHNIQVMLEKCELQ